MKINIIINARRGVVKIAIGMIPKILAKYSSQTLKQHTQTIKLLVLE